NSPFHRRRQGIPLPPAATRPRRAEVDEIAAGMDEHQSRPREPLENESLTAEESRTVFFHPRHRQLHRWLREQERVTLGENTLSRREVESLDASRITSGESDFAGPIGMEKCHKERLPCDGATQRAEQLLAE